MNKNIVITAVLFLFSFSINKAFSQISEEEYHEFTVAVNYNIPIGRLGFAYKPAIGGQLVYSWVHSDLSENVIVKKGLTFGVVQFMPHADTLYYLVDENSYGTAVYSKYSFCSATFHLEHVKTYDKTGLLAAIDAGFGFTNFSCKNNDKNLNVEEEYSQGKLVLIPEIGINYTFNENISTSFGFQYTALISFGGDDIGYYEYNPVIGIYKQYGSITFKAIYSF
ncbi:MAG: hypothetical protein NTX97_07630 [Bacteroidetes bacterium]|nr:hypothetical protein [Bacteroidota bacterium]